LYSKRTDKVFARDFDVIMELYIDTRRKLVLGSANQTSAREFETTKNWARNSSSLMIIEGQTN
jgi:hypothetical protein